MILLSKKKVEMNIEITNKVQERLREKCKEGYFFQNNKYAAMKATEVEVKRAEKLAFLLLQQDFCAIALKVN